MYTEIRQSIQVICHVTRQIISSIAEYIDTLFLSKLFDSLTVPLQFVVPRT